MQRRFTLVELMIVVAIIGVLASVAIPNFHRMQLRARQAEVFGCMDGIITAVRAYEAANSAYLIANKNPYPPPSKEPVPWMSGILGWDELGWSPDGAVRGSYNVSHGVSFGCAQAMTNLDADATSQGYEIDTNGSAACAGYTYPHSGLWTLYDPATHW